MSQKITSLDEFNEIINNGQTVIAFFGATWSGPCKLVGKYFEEFSNEDLFRNLKFINVDIDELQEIAAKAKVQDIPAFLAYRNGKAYEQYNGANRSGLKSFIEKYHSST